jgi:hypothetical protein
MNETKRDALAKAPVEGLAQLPDHHNLRALASDLLNSGLFPAVKNVAGAITIIEYGRELGIPPVAALQTMAIVQGRLCMEAKAMLALYQNHGGRIGILERSKTVARIEFSKDGMKPYVHEYTMEQAKQEKLSGKDNWLKMPETMLFWRAVATGIRLFDPGSVFGLYSKEEMADVTVQFNGSAPATEIKNDSDPIKAELEADGQVVNEPSPQIAGSGKFEYLDRFAKAKKRLGDHLYYEILGTFRYKHVNQVPVEGREKILAVMNQAREDMKKSADKETELF